MLSALYSLGSFFRGRRAVAVGVRVGRRHVGRRCRPGDPGSNDSSGQAVEESGELLVAVVLDDDASALARPGEDDLGSERPPEILLEALHLSVGVGRGLGCWRLAVAQAPHQFFGLANRKVPSHDCFDQLALCLQATLPRAPGRVPRMLRLRESAVWTAASRSSSRSVLAIVERALPTRAAISSWVNANSSASWR